MRILEIIATILDLVISIGMLLVGMYMFFWERSFLAGSVVLGMHALYSTNVILGRIMFELGKEY